MMVDVNSLIQRLGVASKMCIEKKCRPEQCMGYFKKIMHSLRPESGLDVLDVRVTPERQQRLPGTLGRIVIAARKVQEKKLLAEQCVGYLESLLLRFSSQLRENSRSAGQRQDDDRVGLLPHEDPDAYRLLDEFDDGRFPGDFTREDAKRLAAPDALDAPDDFDESGADI